MPDPCFGADIVDLTDPAVPDSVVLDPAGFDSVAPDSVVPDPFGTAALRRGVLDAWAGSPTRFREDANAEEDLRLGGYADTWFVELAQNAADAAGHDGTDPDGDDAGAAGGVRLRVGVADGELRIANTGRPLDAAGVAALASLRASAKRDASDAVGRFGVGFAAVLALSAAPRVVSTSGAVGFSAARTAQSVVALPGPAAELARRAEPPVLRLVWPTAETPPPGYRTEVRLPLRAGVDAAALLAHATRLAPDLLLALPALIEVAVHSGDGVRVLRREHAARRDRTVRWALPLTADGTPDPLVDDVLHAPTPTAEQLGLPARLIADPPLEPDRRRLRPGPAADAVLAAAALTYPQLLTALAPAARTALVPASGFPRSAVDGALREQVVAALAAARWLPGAAGADLVPAQAEWLDLPDAAALAALLVQGPDSGFARLAAPAADPADDTATAAALTRLGAHRVDAAELVARLFTLDRPPGWWRRLYTALAPMVGVVAGLRDELRALPVPLLDGRTAAGPPTVLLPTDPPVDAVRAVAALGLPGLHVAHPDAVTPLLARLGATAADPDAVLAHPALAAAVARSVEDAEAGIDPVPLATAVLGLVATAGDRAPAGSAALALPGRRGPARADELVVPDGALVRVLAADGPLDVLDPAFAAGVSRTALAAVGVLDGFSVLAADDPTGPDHDLDDEDAWWDGLREPPTRLVAVRDLDLIDDDAWPAALALLAADRDTRAAVLVPGGHTAWWLARHARLGGARPGAWRLPTAGGWAGLYDPLPAVAGVDDALLVAIGVRSDDHLHLDPADSTATATATAPPPPIVTGQADAADLLARLADPARRPDPALIIAVHAALAEAVTAGRVDPGALAVPAWVRACDGEVVDVGVAVVLDEPWRAAVLPAGELVAGGDPAALAELLDLPLAAEVIAAELVDPAAGTTRRWSEVAEVVLTCDALGVAVPAGSLRCHDELWLDVRRPATGRRRVPIWRDPSGTWHAQDPLRALLAVLVAS